MVLGALALAGVGIILFERWYGKQQESGAPLSAMMYCQAALIGVARSVAVVPGISRAAVTILGGLALGFNRRAVTELSFLLALPTMAAAVGLDLLKSGWSLNTPEYGLLAVGF